MTSPRSDTELHLACDLHIGLLHRQSHWKLLKRQLCVASSALGSGYPECCQAAAWTQARSIQSLPSL